MKSARYLHFSPFCLDRVEEQLWQGTQLISLRRKPFALLHYLVERAGEVVTKEALLNAVWPDVQVNEGVLTVDIREIRKALGDDAHTPRFIETVHGRGYRFLPTVTTSPVLSNQLSVVSEKQRRRSDSQLATGNWQLTTPLVGREAELSQLHGWWAKALTGERQIVFVTGEAGIGKTALVEEFLNGLAPQEKTNQKAKGKNQKAKIENQILNPKSQIQDPSPWFARGQCIEHYGSSEPYMPILEALGRLGREPDGKRLISVLHQYAPTWLVHLPGLLNATDWEILQRTTQHENGCYGS